MRRSQQVAAPLLAYTAGALLSGCHTGGGTCVNNDTRQVVAQSFCRTSTGEPITTHSYHLEPGATTYGGFGELFEAAAGIALVFGAGKLFGTGG